MMRASWLRLLGVLTMAGCIGVVAGCAGTTARAVVKGKVTIGEKNLTAGTVVFATKDNKASGTGNIDENGNYTVTDAPVGEVTVAVMVPKMGAMMGGKMPGGMMKGPPDGGMKGPDGGPGMAGPAAIDPAKIVQIPAKYADAGTSGLTYKVERGDNTHNITLTP